MSTGRFRARRNGGLRSGRRAGHPKQPDQAARTARGAWLAPVLGAAIIVTLAAAASLAQATPEIFVAASLLFSLAEGIVLAFVANIWSGRGLRWAVLMAVFTAILAAPGRWQVAQVRTGTAAQPLDLAIDLVVSMVWGALAGLAGVTILREKLAALLPRG